VPPDGLDVGEVADGGEDRAADAEEPGFRRRVVSPRPFLREAAKGIVDDDTAQGIVGSASERIKGLELEDVLRVNRIGVYCLL